MDFYPRGQYFGTEPTTKWKKPSIVLISESNYSAGHGFPYAYKTLEIGKLVGMPIPGTMTAVWRERLQDPSLVFGISQVGAKDIRGNYLENQQLEPDIAIDNEYEVVVTGRDQQLERAVQVLMQSLESDNSK
ncbi:MAG: S41 family peptidase [bacterium]